MKTSNLPSLRVDPRLRKAAVRVLKPGETLSAFLEGAVRESIDRRQNQTEFIARGMASLAAVEAGEKTYTIAQVGKRLRARLEKAGKAGPGRGR